MFYLTEHPHPRRNPFIPESGRFSRVMCFSPDQSRTLARRSPENIRPVVDLWTAQ
jgi:Galactose-1-phosphate uridyl transferase, N-terminal domain